MELAGAYELRMREYRNVKLNGFFGIVRENLTSGSLDDITRNIAEETIDRSGRVGQHYVKYLKTKERSHVPAQRFVNAVILQEKGIWRFHGVYPQGLLYRGSESDLLRTRLPGFFLAKYIPGETLFQKIRDGSFSLHEVKATLNLLSRTVMGLRARSLYLLDFAPRDIIISPQGESWNPYLVDTEDLERGNFQTGEALAERQVDQFREDYSPFFDDAQVEEFLKMFFNEKNRN